jgi:hypothetical protein
MANAARRVALAAAALLAVAALRPAAAAAAGAAAADGAAAATAAAAAGAAGAGRPKIAVPVVSGVDQSPSNPADYGRCTGAIDPRIAPTSNWCKFGRLGYCERGGAAPCTRGPAPSAFVRPRLQRVLAGAKQAAAAAAAQARPRRWPRAPRRLRAPPRGRPSSCPNPPAPGPRHPRPDAHPPPFTSPPASSRLPRPLPGPAGPTKQAKTMLKFGRMTVYRG